MSTRAQSGATWKAELREIVGGPHLVTEDVELERLSGDFSLLPFVPAVAAASPESAEEVAAIVQLAAREGLFVTARGGGMSYTQAHTPDRDGVVLLDMRRLARVLEVNAGDLNVSVEVGCTWEELYLTLREHEVRTPFWGTLSGRNATIGGTLSQNGVFYGSGAHGAAAENVLGLRVVLADGTIVRTGSAAFSGATPFTRYYGPDMTGLFLCDSGALGIKVEATLPLMPIPGAVAAATFGFADQRSAVDALRAVARERIASDLFVFDGFYHRLLEQRGFRFLAGHAYSLHCVVEGADRRHAEAGLGHLRSLARNGRELDPSVPLAMRGDPFGATQAMFAGEARAVHEPVNALLPFSRAHDAVEVTTRFFDEHAQVMAEHGIGVWTLMTVDGSNFILEPGFHAPGEYRGDGLDPGVRSTLTSLRRELASRLDALGAVHHQAAKYYDCASRLDAPTLETLEALKNALDPQRLLAPGALGLS